MHMIEALNYLKKRIGNNSPRVSPILVTDTGKTAGYSFRVGNNVLVTGLVIDEMRLRLFVDGILYAAAKRDIKRVAKATKLLPLERNPWLKTH